MSTFLCFGDPSHGSDHKDVFSFFHTPYYHAGQACLLAWQPHMTWKFTVRIKTIVCSLLTQMKPSRDQINQHRLMAQACQFLLFGYFFFIPINALKCSVSQFGESRRIKSFQHWVHAVFSLVVFRTGSEGEYDSPVAVCKCRPRCCIRRTDPLSESITRPVEYHS